MHRVAGFRVVLCLAVVVAAPVLVSAQQVLVKPYLQPGDGSKLEGRDVKVIAWLTDATPGDFTVEADVGGRSVVVKPERTALDFAPAAASKKPEAADKDHPGEKVALPPEREQHYLRYVAKLNDLPFDSDVHYRVMLRGTVVREATFRTRATADKPIRFALVGDMVNGKTAQNAIARRIASERPDFMLALGDIVYPSGRVNQYMHFFWKTYNEPGEGGEAPFMATVPIYPVLGNHDVAAKHPLIPDALGAYYFFAPPKNGPGDGPWNTPLGADKTAAAKFRAANADSYPHLSAYSFDYGPAHVTVLDSNQSSNVDAPKLRAWVEADLKGSKAPWKFVCFHNPSFSSSGQHYNEQAVRLWHPLFEAAGVDMVFTGHVHNYQRTVPLKFAPASPKRDKKGRVDGTFTLDRAFDGESNTRPRGIIHVVAGGGGATLYGPGLDKTAPLLKKEHGDNYADYTARMVADRHSYVAIDLTSEKLTLRATDVDGKPIETITVTKPRP
jgi:predicted phosphodiesterase